MQENVPEPEIEGSLAYHNGVRQSACPYPSREEPAKQWVKGYRSAEAFWSGKDR